MNWLITEDDIAIKKSRNCKALGNAFIFHFSLLIIIYLNDIKKEQKTNIKKILKIIMNNLTNFKPFFIILQN